MTSASATHKCPRCAGPVLPFPTIIGMRWECPRCRQDFGAASIVLVKAWEPEGEDDLEEGEPEPEEEGAAEVVVSLVLAGVKLEIDDHLKEQVVSVVLDPDTARAVAKDLVEMADTMERLARENVG